MAESTQSKYKKVCPKCNGNFVIGWRQHKCSLFGLIGSPPTPILCDCKWGYIFPKEIILVANMSEPKEIIF